MEIDPDVDGLFGALSEEDLKELESCDINEFLSQPTKRSTLEEMAAADENKKEVKNQVDMERLRKFMEDQAYSLEDNNEYIAYVKKDMLNDNAEAAAIVEKKKKAQSEDSLMNLEETEELTSSEISELAEMLEMDEKECNSQSLYRFEEKNIKYDEEEVPKIDIDELMTKLENKDPSTIVFNINNFYEMKPKIFMRLANVLKSSECIISKLELANCRLSDIYIEALAEALKTNKSLVTLNLETNNITVNGFKSLFDVLKSHESIKEFRIANQLSPLGYDGEQMLLELLVENKMIKKVSYYFLNVGFRSQFDRLMLKR